MFVCFCNTIELTSLPFYENINQGAKIDSLVEVGVELFEKYNEYVREQLSGSRKGTRLVTYWSSLKELPASYKLQSSDHMGLLKYWVKTR